MIQYAAWVLISFFAVIGILECIIGVLEFFSMRRIRSAQKSVLQISLSGEEPYAEYLLNTLSLLAERIQVGRLETTLEIINEGLSEETRQRILEYCEKNPWLVFTEE